MLQNGLQKSSHGAASSPVAPATEDQIHRSIVDYLKLYPNLLWFHVPNEGKHKVQYRAKMKRKGVIAGVPDLIFVLPGGRFAGMELKREGGFQSPEQRWFESECKKLGAYYQVCRSIEDVQDVFEIWGVER